MNSKRLVPDDPLGFIKDCVRKGHILWTYHVNMRIKNRFIPRYLIVESIDNFEIIESYPGDKYLPSYLVYSRHEHTSFHVLFGVDVENMNVRVITTYQPNPNEWTEDFKRRRKK